MLTLNATQQRVLGALIEKHMTTPDNYPLTTKALIAACNQSSNRDPIVHLDEETVVAAVNELRAGDAARSIKRSGERAVKHLELADEVFEISRKQKALLAVLMLRGPQTLIELRTRTERYIGFDGVNDVEATLGGMMVADNPTVTLLERQPGQKERRYQHLVGDENPQDELQVVSTSAADVGVDAHRRSTESATDMERLRAEFAELRQEVAELRSLIED